MNGATMQDQSTSRGSVKVLLLAAGLGTRLRPLTDETPKCLIPIGGRALLDYWLDRFSQAGITDVVINTHHLPEQVRVYIDEVNRSGRFHIQESFEATLLGSGGTVHANRGLLDDAQDGLIVYADNLSDVDLGDLIRVHRSHEDALTMMLFRAGCPEKCGIAELDDCGRIIDFIEKPQEPKSNLANAGVYAVTAKAYREMADMDRFDLGFDILPAFVGRMRGWVWDGYHLDIGTHEALEQARKDVGERFGIGREVPR